MKKLNDILPVIYAKLKIKREIYELIKELEHNPQDPIDALELAKASIISVIESESAKLKIKTDDMESLVSIIDTIDDILDYNEGD